MTRRGADRTRTRARPRELRDRRATPSPPASRSRDDGALPPPPSPGLLQRLLGARDDRAWAQLVRTYEPLMVRVIVRSTGADLQTVADIEQDLLVRLLDGGGRRLRVLEGQGDAALRSFLFTAALNAARDHLRRQAVRSPVIHVEPARLEDLPVEAPDDPSMTAETTERVARLLRALDATTGHFPHRDAMIFRAYYLDGYTASEIASMGHGLGPKGVEALVRRMKERLLAWMRRRDPGAAP